jgi:hypothetical protein
LAEQRTAGARYVSIDQSDVLHCCAVGECRCSDPGPAAAASPSKADKATLKRAIVACKAEAKGKKIKFLSRRRYVNNCVTEAMKKHPNMDVTTLLKNHPHLTDLPVERWPGY